jgi:hypothetical protein
MSSGLIGNITERLRLSLSITEKLTRVRSSIYKELVPGNGVNGTTNDNINLEERRADNQRGEAD